MRPSAHTDNHPSRLDQFGRIEGSPPVAPATRRATRRHRALTRLPLLFLLPLVLGVIGGPVASVGAEELAAARARQATLAQQLKDQKADVAKINALQADLGSQIASTRRQLSGINADLSAVKKSITSMIIKINVVKQNYLKLVAQLELLDTQLSRVKVTEQRMRWRLTERKALLSERLRLAYDTDRTSMLETFLSGGTFTDVLSEVSYTIDVGEQDKALAQQIEQDQATLAAIRQTVQETRVATDDLRLETSRQRTKLNTQLKELKAAQAELKRLEAETARALAIQKRAYAKLAADKKSLAKAMAATAAARAALSKRISSLVAAQYASGNIPSRYSGTLSWPMSVPSVTTQNFGCTGFSWEPPLGSCPGFHSGIDIVAPYGTPILASGPGTVVYCGWNYADGADPAWIVIIAHSQGLETWYAHMTSGCPVSAGGTVRAGQVIGHEGNTGRSTGAHLHWAVRQNGSFVNPRLFL